MPPITVKFCRFDVRVVVGAPQSADNIVAIGSRRCAAEYIGGRVSGLNHAVNMQQCDGIAADKCGLSFYPAVCKNTKPHRQPAEEQ